MARNAHPEVTRTRILDAAQRLFMAQGYEHTSIQNIVDELGDLSKGAIYHHFKSKEAILEELTNRDNNMQDDFNESVMNRTDLTALEKFRVLWRHSMTKQDHVQIMRAAMPMLSDPVSFAANMQVWSKHLPERFLPLIEAGVKDGSIPTARGRRAAFVAAELLADAVFLPGDPARNGASHPLLGHHARRDRRADFR